MQMLYILNHTQIKIEIEAATFHKPTILQLVSEKYFIPDEALQTTTNVPHTTHVVTTENHNADDKGQRELITTDPVVANVGMTTHISALK